MKINTSEIDYNPQAKAITLPNSLWVDGYSARCGFIAKLCWLTGTSIIGFDATGEKRDQNSADETEQFWTGMILSLDEQNARNLKKKQNDLLIDNGILQGVALQARGFIVSRYGESALAENKHFFGNSKDPKGNGKK